MAYPFGGQSPYPYYGGQPWQYQDQLSQLRNTPMQMPRTDSGGLNWVQGEAGAKSWLVGPGASVLLMDSEEQRFYIKSADPSGMPTLRTFEYVEVGAKPAPATAPAQGDFVTRAEFNQFVQTLMAKEAPNDG